eukprot:UN13001
MIQKVEEIKRLSLFEIAILKYKTLIHRENFMLILITSAKAKENQVILFWDDTVSNYELTVYSVKGSGT